MPEKPVSASDQSHLAGGCSCGRLRYVLKGAPTAVNCCHCRDCQRLTGSAFALNAVFAAENVVLMGSEWREGDITIGPDDVRSWRCSACQVLLFSEHRAFGERLRFVRVGTLDDGTALQPDAHYFVRSKHPWIAVANGVPAWDTLPPRPDAASKPHP